MPIQVLDRALTMLEALGKQGEAPASAISKDLGLPLSTVGRILDALAAHGLVEKQEGMRRYRLGARLVQLASYVRPYRNIVDVCRPQMMQVSVETNEDVGLAVLQGQQAIIIERIYGPHPLKIIERLSEPVTLNCGAFRKVLLAFQPQPWINNYLYSAKFRKFTDNTITDINELSRELENIRHNMYAISDAEHLPDAAGVGVPVFGVTGQFLGTIFLSIPRPRFIQDAIPKYLQCLRGAARELNGRLYDGPGFP